MLRPVAEFIDSYRIWHKVTFERGRILRTTDNSWEAFDRPEHYAEPRRVFGDGDRVPQVSVRPRGGTELAEVSSFSFPALHRIEGYPYAETNVATGRIYRLRGARRAPMAVLSHGWAHRGEGGLRAVEVIYVEPLLKAGFSVALLSHPFHFERTPAGTYSGELMVSGDVVLTVEAFRQSVADLVGLVNWLRGSGDAVVGLVGYSLGGYLAALVACLRDDLDFVVIGAAGGSVVSPILDTGLGVNVREDLASTGMDHREQLERAWGIISPERLSLRVDSRKVLLVAGRYDRIMLRDSVVRLWEKWGRPPISWEDQGHYTLLAVPGRLVRRSLVLLREVALQAGATS